jgi:hypothetical protein
MLGLLTYGLQVRLDKLVYVCPAHLSQATYANAWDGAVRQKFVGSGTAKPEDLSQLLGTHQVFSLFSLQI